MTGSKDLVVDMQKIPSMPTNVEWGDASLSSNHDPPPEANTYKRSMLGFRYPFCNGSFDVSNKGLRNPNRPFNILMRRTNKFGINMPITSTA